MTEMNKLILFSAKNKLKKMNQIQTVEVIEKLEKENEELKEQLKKYEDDLK